MLVLIPSSGHASTQLNRLAECARDPLSSTRFLACAHLCGQDISKKHQETGLYFMQGLAHTYGDKDQYEAADYLLTYGNESDRKKAKKSLLWIFENSAQEKDDAVFSLWIHGDKGIRKTLRPYIRSKAREGGEASYNFAELLNNHGNQKDRLIASTILARWNIMDADE